MYIYIHIVLYFLYHTIAFGHINVYVHDADTETNPNSQLAAVPASICTREEKLSMQLMSTAVGSVEHRFDVAGGARVHAAAPAFAGLLAAGPAAPFAPAGAALVERVAASVSRI